MAVAKSMTALNCSNNVEITDVKQYILDWFASNELVVPEYCSDAFENHLAQLAQRLENNELASEEDLMSDFDENIMEMSKGLLEPLFEKFNLSENKMEEMLIGIYIQLAKGDL